MKVSVILAHPDQNSFNHAIADMAVQTLQGSGHEVIYHDLYAEEFDPILVTATAGTGISFTGWGGSCGASGTSNPITIGINSDCSVVGNFIIN